MKLIVGLGNPGKKYEGTRHNVGFEAVDFLRTSFNFDEFKRVDKHKCDMTEGVIGEEKVILIKPQTYMNLSGQSVRSVAQFYKIPMDEVIVIYDDVDLPSGNLRVRPNGSAGGHKGIKSLIQELGTEEFIRVRLGIAPIEVFRGNLEDYVLGKLKEEESILLEGNIKKLPELLELLFSKGVEEVMQHYN